MRWGLIILLVIAMAALSLSLLACDKKATDAITILLEGELYRGAVVPLSADMPTKLAADARFEVTQGDRYCYIYNGNLQVLNDAMVGATVTVRVSSGEQYAELSREILPTPVRRVTVDAIAHQQAGADVTLYATVEPWYATDNAVTYTLSQGADVATLEGNVLRLSADADHQDMVQVVAHCGGVDSMPVQVPIDTIQPRGLQLSASITTLQRGQSATLQSTVTPADAKTGVQYSLVPNDYNVWVTLSDNTVTVDKYEAPEGTFSVMAKAGKCTQTLQFVVEKTPVSEVYMRRTDNTDSQDVRLGATVGLTTNVYPANATYPTVTYQVLDGAEYIEMHEDGFTVTTDKPNVSFIIVAMADGKSDEKRFVTQGIPLEDIRLTVQDGLSTEVTAGETRTIAVQMVPQNASETPILLLENEDYATLSGNTITFGQPHSDNEVVRVLAIGDSVQRYIEFHIVPIPVQQVVLTTDSNTQRLSKGDTVVLQAQVIPANATYSAVSYRIAQGAGFGTLQDNEFTVKADAAWGQVTLEAVSEGNVVSNAIVVQIAGQLPAPTFATWQDLDNNPALLANDPAQAVDYTTACLDLRAMPTDAQDTVVIVSDDVQDLTIMGGYDGTLSTCFTNLYFYFLTTDSITVHIRGLGIVIDNGFTDTVLDFGDSATVTLDLSLDNYIAAGSAYCVSTDGFMLEGAYDAQYSMRLKGMDGFSGMDGGVALAAYDLTLVGDGNLHLVGGNASSGTDGTAGADATIDNAQVGNGGNGGTGGSGGAALLCHSVTYAQHGALVFAAGSGGTGGSGGAAGMGGGNTGVRGRDGASGTATTAVVADIVVVQTQLPRQSMGGVKANRTVRPLGNLVQSVALYQTHYKINIYYAAGWQNLHAVASGGVSYSMTKQTDSRQLFRLLRGMDYTLAVFGRNVFADLTQIYGHAPNFYLCDTITAKRGLKTSTVYGLTDDGGNVWYATFTTRPRDTFYSTYYNIMVHEVFHLLHYGLDSKSTAYAALTESALRSRFNKTDSVYTGEDSNVPFLTTYSKTSNMEDISETLSILCILPRATDYSATTATVGKKAAYINGVFADYYHSLSRWRTPYWMRWVV